MTQWGSSAVPTTPVPLTTDERAELEHLRSQVRAQQTAGRPARRGFRWRSLFAVVLIVLGCVLAPVAGLAVWTSNQVSDTDRFVRSVSPLVDDPDVQAALTERLTDTVFEYVDVASLATDAVDALEEVGVPPQLVDRLETFTPTITWAVTGFVRDRIAQLVASDAFEATWDRAIAVARRHGRRAVGGRRRRRGCCSWPGARSAWAIPAARASSSATPRRCSGAGPVSVCCTGAPMTSGSGSAPWPRRAVAPRRR
jgi:hypothetical protein